MADRRMITKKVTDDDNFMSLSSSAQALYLHLNMSADDDGFNNQVTVSMFKAHASVDDLKALLEKRYIYQFENGVIVIKHWRMANALRKDRYTPTAFKEEMKQLGIKENGSYTLLGNQTATKRQPNGNQTATQVRLDKVSIEEVNKEIEDLNNKTGLNKVIENQIDGTQRKRFVKPTLEEVRDYCTEKHYNVNPEHFIDYYESNGWKVGRNSMKDWKAAVRNWARRDKENQPKGYNSDWQTVNETTETQEERDERERRIRERLLSI